MSPTETFNKRLLKKDWEFGSHGLDIFGFPQEIQIQRKEIKKLRKREVTDLEYPISLI